MIPFDVLLHPTEYFCGAYPYCLDLIELAKKNKGDHTPQFVDTFASIKQESDISLHRAIAVLKHQFGKYIKAFGEIFTVTYGDLKTPNYQKIFEKICTSKKEDYYPKRLKMTANYYNPKSKYADLDKILNHITVPTTKQTDFEKELFDIWGIKTVEMWASS